jgi:putative transposase
VYGVRKLWHQLRREDEAVGRDQVGRLMRALGLAGATRTKRIRTTKPAAVEQRPADVVERVFVPAAPNRLWVADLTYVWTRAGSPPCRTRECPRLGSGRADRFCAAFVNDVSWRNS